jgi:hypothetical protein
MGGGGSSVGGGKWGSMGGGGGWQAGDQPRPVVFITGRVHPGETPASYVTQVETCMRDVCGRKVALACHGGAGEEEFVGGGS